MKLKQTNRITQGALIAAMYFVLTHLQNFILPGSTTWVIQCRLAEVLCILAFFTPAAIPGLTIGCLLFNLSYSGALPLDFLVGSLATLLAAVVMWYTRNMKVKGLPLLGLAMPALFNAVLVGWELAVYIGDTGFTMQAFAINAVYVAIGEAIVLFIPGIILYKILNRNTMARQLLS